MKLLLVFCLASLALALKTPTLCPNDKGNEFVCSAIAPVNKEESYSEFPSITDVTIAQNGQTEFFNSVKALEVLRGSLRTQTNTEALKTNPYSWFQTLGKVTGQLESAKTGTQKLVNSVASGLKKLQTSFDKTTTANANKVTETAAEATKKLSQEIDQKAITYYTEEYNSAVAKCKSAVSKQVETLQNRIRQGVEKSYDSLIDLTDQIGLCIQNNDTQGKCARNVQIKLNAVRSLGRTSEINASNMERIGNKSFEKDACLRIALKRFDDSVKKVLKTASKNK